MMSPIFTPTSHLCQICFETRRRDTHAKCRKLLDRTREEVLAESNRELSEQEVVYRVVEMVRGVYAKGEHYEQATGKAV